MSLHPTPLIWTAVGIGAGLAVWFVVYVKIQVQTRHPNGEPKDKQP